MRDGGVAAMNYLDRDAGYAAQKESLSCHVRNYYYDRERNEARLRTFVGGAVVVVSSVATGGTALILSGAMLAASAYNVKNVCGNITNGAHTLQSEPVCEIFRENKDKLDTVQVMQKHLDNESCKMAQIEAALDAGGVATSAFKLTKLGKGAQQVPNGLDSIGELNKLNRAAEKLAGKDADTLLLRLSSSNPEKQKKNYQVLEALSKHEDLSLELGKLNTDGLAAVVSKIDSPEVIENLSALQKLDPTEFSRQTQELMKACVRTASLWNLVVPPAEAALCDVTAIDRIIKELSVIGGRLPLEVRGLLRQGYKPRKNVSIKSLEDEGYVYLDVLEKPGQRSKVLARDAEGKTHLLDVKPGDLIERGLGHVNPVSGANELTKRRVLARVAKDPSSVSEANWRALRRSEQLRFRRSAQREAESLGNSNKLQGSQGFGSSKGHLEVKYGDGTTKTYRYSRINGSNNWTELGTGKNAAPDFEFADVVTYVDESGMTAKREVIVDVESKLSQGLRKNDRPASQTSQTNTVASAPKPSTPPAPQTWHVPGKREFTPNAEYRFRNSKGVEMKGPFVRFFQGDKTKPTFRVNGQELVGSQVFD